MNTTKNTTLVSGISFIKNGLTLGYPIKESIESIEPLCDEIIINVGFEDQALTKDDGTYQYLRDHLNHPKFIFTKSWWDPKKTTSGLILSEQTNIALAKAKGKLVQYIQADEAIHEDHLQVIHNEMINMERTPQIEGLVFDYLHFYGNLDVIRHTRATYRREVRTIRNGIGLKSYLDAQGFRHQDDSKPLCKKIDANIFHYGWARPKQVMAKKIMAMDKLYHGDDFNRHAETAFDYNRIWGLRKFNGTHPKIVQNWVEQNKSDLDVLNLKLKFHYKDVRLAVSDLIESVSGYRLGEFTNYRLL